MTARASTGRAESVMSAVTSSTLSLNPPWRLRRDLGRTVERNPQTAGKLRPVDLARRHGLSTQAVRNYEDAGSLPPAARTAHGYRVYTPVHAAALRAFLALVPGHGHQTAALVMRAVNRGRTGDAPGRTPTMRP